MTASRRISITTTKRKFTEVAVTSGMALTVNGAAMAAMCISLGDYDNDGFLDLYISDFQLSSGHSGTTMAKPSSMRSATRRASPCRPSSVLSFGGGFFDFDNDGWLDLFIANGHVYEECERVTPDIHYKQINSLFHNEANGKFTEVTKISGDGFTKPYAARGAAFADFDNDGNVDIVVANSGDAPTLLRNTRGTGNHFLTLKLVGTTSQRDAVGARVTVSTGGIARVEVVVSGGSSLRRAILSLVSGWARRPGGEREGDRLASRLRRSIGGVRPITSSR